MNRKDQEYYWYWFVNIPGIGNRSRLELIQRFGHPSVLYDCSEDDLKEILNRKQISNLQTSKDYLLAEQGLSRLVEAGCRFIHWESDEYPNRLRNLYDPPFGFYLRGKLPQDDIPAVAMIGSRRSTPYGRKAAEIFSKELASMGIAIISGMAAGIDASAHKAALEVGGCTLGILGGGVDTMYPRSNSNLYLDMYQYGGILSEHNLGVPNKAGLFPIRNRLISGMADIILVVEAGLKSGSLITADQGMEQGKEVYALPGRITDPISKGCNHLIAQGAYIAENPEDLLAHFPEFSKIDACQSHMNITLNSFMSTEDNLTEIERNILHNLDINEGKSFESIMRFTGLSVAQLQHYMMNLELKNLVVQHPQNLYRKK